MWSKTIELVNQRGRAGGDANSEGPREGSVPLSMGGTVLTQQVGPRLPVSQEKLEYLNLYVTLPTFDKVMTGQN